jgi:hypothetical protein
MLNAQSTNDHALRLTLGKICYIVMSDSKTDGAHFIPSFKYSTLFDVTERFCLKYKTNIASQSYFPSLAC